MNGCLEEISVLVIKVKKSKLKMHFDDILQYLVLRVDFFIIEGGATCQSLSSFDRNVKQQ